MEFLPLSEEYPLRCACIDCGTNTIKVLIADVYSNRVESVYQVGNTTRIGEGMQTNGMRLCEAPMRRTLDALDTLMSYTREFEVDNIVAVGTAALRDAQNSADFVQRVQDRFGIQLEVISGEEEARLSFQAVRRDNHWVDYPSLVVIDIGGGSTEIIQGNATSHDTLTRMSVNLGAVKLTERALRSDPPTVSQLQEATRTVLEAFDAANLPAAVLGSHVVGVGGTLTTLGAIYLEGIANAEVLHGLTLHSHDLERIIERLASMSVEERKELPGLDPARADIILAGAMLLNHALAKIKSDRVDISTRGLRWGVIYDRFWK